MMHIVKCCLLLLVLPTFLGCWTVARSHSCGYATCCESQAVQACRCACRSCARTHQHCPHAMNCTEATNCSSVPMNADVETAPLPPAPVADEASVNEPPVPTTIYSTGTSQPTTISVEPAKRLPVPDFEGR